MRTPIEQRFWSKVNKFSGTGCWLWTAATIRGYGQIAGVVNGKKRPVYAHRVAWEFAHGPVPEGACVLHKCDVPLCVRVDHLFLGSLQDNLADARQKGRLDETRPRTSRLTPLDRMAIYSAKGYRGVCVDLARQYGVTKACISVIRKGRFKRPGVTSDRARRQANQPLQPETPALQQPSGSEDAAHRAFHRVFVRVPSVQLPVLGDVC